MTRLLVSVRDAREARAALRGGADVIDIKEPRAGSLGAASPQVCRDVLRVVGGSTPVSVALGELTDRPEVEIVRGMTYAKLGLAGAAGLPDWSRGWRQRWQLLPKGTQPVAVIYADWQRAAAPPPSDIVDAARAAACRVVLVDTFCKDAGDLFDHLSARQLGDIMTAAHADGALVVLAGSLRGPSLLRAARLGADLVAVRGAVARPGRTGRVQQALVADLVTTLRGNAPAVSPGAI